jgi:hypothetical protein
VSARSQAETIKADAVREPDVDWRAQIATLRAKMATVLVCGPTR